MTWQNIIYLGKYSRPKASERARPYALSHEIYLAADPTSRETTTILGASLDHLAGYLDAARVTARDPIKVYNGFPQERFKRRRIKPLDATAIHEIYELAELDEHWIPITDLKRPATLTQGD